MTLDRRELWQGQGHPRGGPADIMELDDVATAPAQREAVTLGALIVPLTPAADVAEGLPPRHAQRTALVAVGVGSRLGLGHGTLSNLYFAALLKDLGATTARAKATHTFGPGTTAFYHALHHADLSTLRSSVRLALPLLRSGAPLGRRLSAFLDITLGSARNLTELERLRTRTAASIALDMGFDRGVGEAILAQNERWDGHGRPDGYEGDKIPLTGRVLNVAQAVVDAWSAGGVVAAAASLLRLSGTRLDPQLVEHAISLLREPEFVARLAPDGLEAAAVAAEPGTLRAATASRADRIFAGFARFIDAKSPWTHRHSERVLQLAQGAAMHLDAPLRLSASAIRRLKRAAWLHDLARVATPNEVLDSKKTFSDAELDLLLVEPSATAAAVARVLDLADHAPITETYVGMEPPELLDAPTDLLSDEATGELIAALLRAAEKFEAMTAPRPHRAGKPFDEAIATLRRESAAQSALCHAVLLGLERFLATPTAAKVLAPRTFEPEGIVVIS